MRGRKRAGIRRGTGYVVAVLTRLRPHAPALAALLCVAAILMFPAITKVGHSIPGHPQSDAYEHLQGYAWVARAWSEGRFPWQAEGFGLPTGGVLWFPDLLAATLLTPLTWAAGAAVAFLVGEFAAVLAGLLGGYLLGWRVAGSRGPALLSAVIFGASPYVLGLLHSGVSEYLHTGAFALLWLGTERAVERGGRWMGLAGLAFGWLGWSNVYYGCFAPFLVLAVLLQPSRVPWPSRLRRGAGVVAVGLALLVPAAVAIEASLRAPDALLREESAPGWDWVFLPATDLASFFVPGDQLFPDFRDGGNFGIRHVSYLGWIAVLCGVAGGRRWWAPAALAGVLALGPTLHWRGQPVRVGGHFIPLPAAILYVPGSPFRLVHHPYRWTVLPMLVLAGAAADGLRRRPRAALALAGGVLAESLLGSPGDWPVDTASLAGVAELPGPGGQWDLPPDFGMLDRRWMGLQAVHGRDIPYTINVFLPEPWRGNQLYQSVMGCLDHPERHTIARDARPPLAVWLRHDSPQSIGEGIAQVRGWGIRFLVLHRDVVSPREQTCFTALFGDAGLMDVPQSDPGLVVWDLGE